MSPYDFEAQKGTTVRFRLRGKIINSERVEFGAIFAYENGIEDPLIAIAAAWMHVTDSVFHKLSRRESIKYQLEMTLGDCDPVKFYGLCRLRTCNCEIFVNSESLPKLVSGVLVAPIFELKSMIRR